MGNWSPKPQAPFLDPADETRVYPDQGFETTIEAAQIRKHE
jgi:hypothetical protein